MKTILTAVFCIAATGFPNLLKAQTPDNQDPRAKTILDRVAARANQQKSIQTDFELVIEDRKDKSKTKSTGSLLIKNNKYRITTPQSVVYFNGKTMWTHMIREQEVTITEPEPDEDDPMGNPARFFTLYSRDFKYRYVKQTTVNEQAYHEIDLFPNNLNQPYSRIKVFVGVNTEMPGIISSIGKDGVDYTFFLKNYVLDREVADLTFSFDQVKNKKVEVIDLRGVE